MARPNQLDLDVALAPDPADPDAWPEDYEIARWSGAAVDPYGFDYPERCEVYVGTHRPHWLHPGRRAFRPRGPLFVSIRQLTERRRSPYPRCDTAFAIDSGGYTELRAHGRWVRSPEQYVDEVRAIADQTGTLDWAAAQDWMVEDDCLRATGLTVEEHQDRSVESFCRLRQLAPDVAWLPVIQGQTIEQYERHVEAFEAAGVHLRTMARVGVGSVCRRQGSTEIAELLRSLARMGMRLHGFGVKTLGLERVGSYLASVDSTAWSLHARKRGRDGNSQHEAEAFRDRLEVAVSTAREAEGAWLREVLR